MNPRTPLSAAAITAAALTLTTTAGAQNTDARCQLTATPWDGHAYQLAVLHPNGTITTLLEQGGPLPDIHTWAIDPATVDSVLWAARQLPANSPDDYYDRYHVTMSCDFVEPYNGQPGRPDSLTITDMPATPTTTTTTAEGPILVVATTPIPEIATTAPLPPAVVDTAGPEQPSLQVAPVLPTTDPNEVVLYTATSLERALPNTGADTVRLAWAGVLSLFAGLFVLGLTLLRRKTIKENQA